MYFSIYLFINFIVVCVCVCVAFFALTLCYILLSFLSILYGVYTRDCSCISLYYRVGRPYNRGERGFPLTQNITHGEISHAR